MNNNELFRKYKLDPTNLKIRNQIVLNNRGLVRKIANKLQGIVEFDDLEQIGYIGLIRAVGRFKLTQGAAFSSFAAPYIRGEMLHYIRDKSRLVKQPRQYNELVGKSKKLSHLESSTEMADALGVSVLTWKLAKQSSMSARSLDAPLADDNCSTVGDTIADHIGYENLLLLGSLLDSLEERERQVVEMIHLEEMTQKAIGSAIGLSSVTVSRCHKSAMKQLQAMVA